MSETFPRIEPLGTEAFLVRFSDQLDDAANRACVAYRTALERARKDGRFDTVEETASSLGSVLVRMTAEPGSVRDGLMELLDGRDWFALPPSAQRHWRIPCSFGGEDGPQLNEVADLVGLDAADAVEALAAASVRVLALGFAPGMPYLGILPPLWDIPRQTGLTPKVPKGALVVAVRQFVLFGTEAPTGWRQVGLTGFDCFSMHRPNPIALAPGDEVSFEPVSPEVLRARIAADPAGHGGAKLTEMT